MASKTLMLSCRVAPCVREALEKASVRDRRSLSNFIERAVIDALPQDLKRSVMKSLESDALNAAQGGGSR